MLSFLMICCVFPKNQIFWYLQTTLLSIVWELAGGESLAVAVDISDMWQVTGDTRHMTGDTRQVKHDT